MGNRIDVDSLSTITDHLKALAEINDSIADIRYQLDYSNGDDGWRRRAGMALHKCKSIRTAIQGRLAILRQKAKVQNVELHVRTNDLLVKELKKHVSESVFKACELMAWAGTATEYLTPPVEDQTDEFADQVIGTKTQIVRLPPTVPLFSSRAFMDADALIKFVEAQGYIVEVTNEP